MLDKKMKDNQQLFVTKKMYPKLRQFFPEAQSATHLDASKIEKVAHHPILSLCKRLSAAVAPVVSPDNHIVCPRLDPWIRHPWIWFPITVA